MILAEDALAANGPHVNLLRELNISFIIVVKPKGNASLFNWVEGFDWEEESEQDESQGEHFFICPEGKHISSDTSMGPH